MRVESGLAPQARVHRCRRRWCRAQEVVSATSHAGRTSRLDRPVGCWAIRPAGRAAKSTPSSKSMTAAELRATVKEEAGLSALRSGSAISPVHQMQHCPSAPRVRASTGGVRGPTRRIRRSVARSVREDGRPFVTRHRLQRSGRLDDGRSRCHPSARRRCGHPRVTRNGDLVAGDAFVGEHPPGCAVDVDRLQTPSKGRDPRTGATRRTRCRRRTWFHRARSSRTRSTQRAGRSAVRSLAPRWPARSTRRAAGRCQSVEATPSRRRGTACRGRPSASGARYGHRRRRHRRVHRR